MGDQLVRGVKVRDLVEGDRIWDGERSHRIERIEEAFALGNHRYIVCPTGKSYWADPEAEVTLEVMT